MLFDKFSPATRRAILLVCGTGSIPFSGLAKCWPHVLAVDVYNRCVSSNCFIFNDSRLPIGSNSLCWNVWVGLCNFSWTVQLVILGYYPQLFKCDWYFTHYFYWGYYCTGASTHHRSSSGLSINKVLCRRHRLLSLLANLGMGTP